MASFGLINVSFSQFFINSFVIAGMKIPHDGQSLENPERELLLLVLLDRNV